MVCFSQREPVSLCARTGLVKHPENPPEDHREQNPEHEGTGRYTAGCTSSASTRWKPNHWVPERRPSGSRAAAGPAFSVSSPGIEPGILPELRSAGPPLDGGTGVPVGCGGGLPVPAYAALMGVFPPTPSRTCPGRGPASRGYCYRTNIRLNFTHRRPPRSASGAAGLCQLLADR